MFRIGLATAALALALPAAAEAQSGDLVGCWRDPGPDVKSTVCFEGRGGGTFSLIWSLDDGSGWSEGKCNGYVDVTHQSGGTVDWEVPRQADMCFQDGAWDRLARRTYECEMSDVALTCTVRVFLDDGTEWGDPAVGVMYDRVY